MTTLFQSLSSLTPLQIPSTPDKALEAHQPSSALHRLSQSDTQHARSVFLTLQVLFPHELLPALDILDRGLVTRFTVQIGDGHKQENESRLSALPDVNPDARYAARPDEDWEVYYIQSSSAVTSRPTGRGRSTRSRTAGSSRYSTRRHDAGATFYEVRLDSWNCNCPAFSVSAFQGMNAQGDGEDVCGSVFDKIGDLLSSSGAASVSTERAGWVFGGVTTNISTRLVPSCKHILAAVLAKAAPNLFASGVRAKKVSREELTAWGGGWGELGVQ
ncbi:hypothetical protein A1O3_08376 [Capronia epimyces CBS 606.96]|uniref:SWIM-type domain-containing protein n=1 Tax=Capronia epimyces CBS 606.96 TaxID=1182542 RepID=W9XRX8_9EURO|nr:uncharacterized protein A1O3_08376 [Capronia epimyces CBS 606.96]EXJ80090.1 hypothetical protein A1O3_08376 [Capronia epimyces CBS 606.96]